MSEQPTEVLAPQSFNGDVDDDDFVLERPTEQPAGASVLEALKAQRAVIAEQHTFDVAIPGWNDLLVLRLGAITGQQHAKIIERAARTSRSIDTDFLTAAFREVLGRDKPDGELTLLVDGDGDPVGLDKRLAAMLDLGEVQSARDVLVALFSGANSPPTAIANVSNDWLQWARSAGDDVDEAYLGE